MSFGDIIGTDGDDELAGLLDPDTIYGLGGNDTLDGFVGNDELHGDIGRDFLYGGHDDDYLTGDDGDDKLDGGVGEDRMYGGLGDDIYVVDDPDDYVSEEAYWYFDKDFELVDWAAGGDDTVEASISYALPGLFPGIYGQVENLTLTGNADIDGTGNELANVIRGNNGANVLSGGAGNDTYYVGAGDTVAEVAAEGLDTVHSETSFMLAANIENLTLTGSAAIDGGGNALANVIKGNGAANVLTGATGNDTYYIGAGDMVIELVGEGADRVYSSASFVLGQNVEDLTLTGTGTLAGTGNGLVNRIYGNSGNNLLDGRGGADRMEGGRGNDTYHVDNVGDGVLEMPGAIGGVDIVISTVTWTLGADVENLTLSGTVKLNGFGNALGNTLIGNGNVNRLDGGSGRDDLIGGPGSDVLSGGRNGEADRFIFKSPSDGGAKGDTILDFERGVDRIALDHAGFGLSGAGSLAGRGVAFVVGERATGAGPTVVFKPFADEVWWDGDGTGALAPLLLAAVPLSALANLAAGDFIVI